MNDLLAALLLGIIEGITEFLPISSTGHLLIAERWLGHRSDLFNISIQAGAILAVVLIYRQRLIDLTLGLRERNKRDYVLKLLLAFGVTAALGIVVKKLGFELPETIEPVAWALLLGGFVMLGAEAIDARRVDLPDDDPDAIGWGTAVLVGLAQVLAGVFPGTSRSAAAIFAALLFGKSTRLAATEFAFLVGIPTMFAATGYELMDMLSDGSAANEDWSALGVAFVASAVTAFVAVKWLLRYIQTHRFTVFAWYRIVFGAALLAMLYFGSPMGEAHAATGTPPAPASSSATVLREFAVLHRCRLAMHARGPGKFDQAEPDCAQAQRTLMDGGGYALAYRAAELGDSLAAQCFVAGAFAMPPKMHERAGVLDQWRLDAAHIIERGIARGDWHMVYAARMAYGAPEVQRQPRFDPPHYEPGLHLIWTIGGGDGVPDTAYRVMTLMALGADSARDAENYRQDAGEFSPKLPSAQRRAADAWARKALRTQFDGRPMRPENTDFCQTP